jgi:hypothetical protein
VAPDLFRTSQQMMMITPGLLWQRRKGGGGGCSNSSARWSITTATALHNYHSRLFGVPPHLRRAAAAAVSGARRGFAVNLLIDGRGREDLAVGGVLLRDGLVGRALCVTVRTCRSLKKTIGQCMEKERVALPLYSIFKGIVSRDE